jgi:hypothetical protein
MPVLQDWRFGDTSDEITGIPAICEYTRKRRRKTMTFSPVILAWFCSGGNNIPFGRSISLAITEPNLYPLGCQ